MHARPEGSADGWINLCRQHRLTTGKAESPSEDVPRRHTESVVTRSTGFYNADMWRHALMAIFGTILVTTAAAQTPQPFPRGTTQPPPAPAPGPAPAPAPVTPTTTPPAAAATLVDPATPSESTLGFPVYPAAQFIAPYDAGRGQRYYIFGSTASFTDLVNYYRTQLKEKGNLVFQEPPTHMFEIGRFNDDTMAFPPGVTIKDWTWTGSEGYPNPKPGGQPARYPSVIMIVPAPAGQPVR